ncbi:mannose-1-phosphate guanylyltransferase [Bacteroides pyogenes JCM 6292]|uniref:Mannose-1-phosphate guanylyltransferase n=2 Tax=Bacteroides pyogenes TaxID=310300 RepID=W4PCS9_9BACE|nr:mannose-1-phosphate guanylyltransferase [Bacteroides pyogenes JCM 6292]GAE17572.1 mannose-1-phosphate guanylyltransferase [Bacteroides pyogenes DSM 20611 = JCM 6294]
MEVNPLVFETSASTDSAIWACIIDLSIAVQRYNFIFNPQ